MTKNAANGRVRKTKRLLREGLTHLLAKKSINKIKVLELTELMDVNRGTFYLHYKNIRDFVEQTENELFEEFEAILSSHTIEEVLAGPEPLIADVCAFLTKNRELCSGLLGEGGDADFRQRVRAFVREKYLQEFSALHEARDIADFELLYAYFEAGIVGALRCLLYRPQDEKTPGEVADFVSSIFLHGVHGYTVRKKQPEKEI